MRRFAIYRSWLMSGGVYAPHLVPHLSRPMPWVSLQQMLASHARGK
jgi:hypothetical protein